MRKGEEIPNGSPNASPFSSLLCSFLRPSLEPGRAPYFLSLIAFAALHAAVARRGVGHKGKEETNPIILRQEIAR